MNQTRVRIATMTVLALLTIACNASAEPTIKTRIEPVDHVPTSRTTVIDSQVTWGPGLKLVDEDVTIVDGGYLWIQPGTDVVMTAAAEFLVEAGGWLMTFGSSTDPVTFSGYNDTTWDGIHLIGEAGAAGSTKLHLRYTTFEDAYPAAVWGYNANVFIDDSEFDECSVQLQSCHGYFSECTVSGASDFGAYVVGAYFHILDCTVTGGYIGIGLGTVGTGNGIVSGCSATGGDFGASIAGDVEVENCNFSSNDYGLLIGGPITAATEYSDCVINSNSYAGVFAGSGSPTAIFTDCDISYNGINVQIFDSGPEILLGNDATGEGGGNRIVDPTTYHVDNQGSTTVKAENCYWGFAFGQVPNLNLNGRVDYTPMLYTDPFAKSANDVTARPFECSVFPNPCNPAAGFRFTIPTGGGDVELSVYDVRGRIVQTLVESHLPAGQHEATWRGTDSHGRAQSSGVYLYRLTLDGRPVSTGRVVLAR